MSTLNVDKVDPNTGTALEIGSSGDTISVPSGATLDISASTLTPPATMPASSAANLTNIPGANITGTIAAVSGANLTSLTATNLGSGTVPTARLGTGTASSSVFLAGDSSWIAAGGGKILQVTSGSYAVEQTISAGTNTAAGFSAALTPSATSSDILILWSGIQRGSVASATGVYVGTSIWGDIGGAGYNNLGGGAGDYQSYVHGFTGEGTGELAVIGGFSRNTMWSPSTTSACTVKIYHMGASAIQYSSVKSEIVLLEIDGS